MHCWLLKSRIVLFLLSRVHNGSHTIQKLSTIISVTLLHSCPHNQRTKISNFLCYASKWICCSFTSVVKQETCSSSVEVSLKITSSEFFSTSSMGVWSTFGGRGPWGFPKTVVNICRWHSTQKKKYVKWPSYRSLCSMLSGRTRCTKSLIDGGTTRSSAPYLTEFESRSK